MRGYALLWCNISQPRFQLAIPRLDSQPDGENSNSYAILSELVHFPRAVFACNTLVGSYMTFSQALDHG